MFSVLRSDIDKKSPYIGHPFVFISRRSALGTAAIAPAIHQNHSDRYTHYRIVGRQPRMKRIGHEYRRKENGDQYSSCLGHNHHPLSRNAWYTQFRHHQDYRLLVLFRRDRNDGSVGRGLENSVDGYVLHRKCQSCGGVVDERY